jgi:hypothetical protein
VSRRIVLAVVVAIAGAVAVGAAALVGSGDGQERPRPALGAVHLERCTGVDAAGAVDCYAREFLAMVKGQDDPRPAVAAITRAARREGGFLLSNCHVIMHTVGRAYVRDAKVNLASLMDRLPRDNDPGCPAGFAHGLVTGVAPDIDPSHPADAARACGKAGTRFQRYSCIHGFGHAFMRLYSDHLQPALKLCRALGPRQAPDCAQGAYHDYWFAVAGADDAKQPANPVTNPRDLCAAQPADFVRPCWYRGLLERRPQGFQLETAEDLDGACVRLAGLQREACITAASVIGPPDPAQQLRICARLEAASDAASCVRGTKAQNLIGASTATYVRLIGGCRRFAAAPRPACYRWLGKALAVLTDGRFGREGCPRLTRADARRECEAGARRMDDALVTFS